MYDMILSVITLYENTSVHNLEFVDSFDHFGFSQFYKGSVI